MLKTDGERIVANASLVQYNEITAENIDSFHFHGDDAALPLTAVLPVPVDDKARVLMLGRYQDGETLQLLEPGHIIQQLLDTVFAVERYVLLAMGLVAVATGSVVALVFLLSWRARQAEQQTLTRLGGARGAIVTLMLAEVLMIVAAAVILASLLTLLTDKFGGPLLRAVLLQ